MSRLSVPVIQNLVVRSNRLDLAPFFTNTGVTVTANTTDLLDPVGTNTANKVTYSGSGTSGDFRVYQQGVGTSNVGMQNTLSFWGATLSGTRVIRITDNNSGVLTPFTLTTTWQKFTVTQTTVIAGSLQFTFYDNTGVNTAGSFYIYECQEIIGNWAGPPTHTDAAAVNTGAIRSLASGRSNVPVVQNFISQSVGASAWNLGTGVTLTANTSDTLDPLGGSTAVKAVYDGSSTSGTFKMYMLTSIVFPVSRSTYTGSIYVKLASGTRPMILNINGQSPVSFTATTSWQRIIVTSANWNPAFFVILDLVDGVGQNSAFTFYVFGPQMVNANWAGELVQTNGSAVNTGNIRNLASGRVSS